MEQIKLNGRKLYSDSDSAKYCGWIVNNEKCMKMARHTIKGTKRWACDEHFSEIEKLKRINLIKIFLKVLNEIDKTSKMTKESYEETVKTLSNNYRNELYELEGN